MASKPTDKLGIWAAESSQKTKPSDNLERAGFEGGNPLPVQIYNYKHNVYTRWLKYFEDVIDEGGISGGGGGGATTPAKPSTIDLIVSDEASADHSTLASALTAANDGQVIYVKKSETVNTTLNVNNNNLKIIFHTGFSLTKGTATTGLIVSADNVQIEGLKIQNFNTANDVALSLSATSSRCIINKCVFISNDIDIKDEGKDNIIKNNNNSYNTQAVTNNSTATIIKGVQPMHAGILFKRFFYTCFRKAVVTATSATTFSTQAGFINLASTLQTTAYSVNYSSLFDDGSANYEAGISFALNAANRLVYSSTNLTGDTVTGNLHLKQVEGITVPVSEVS